MNQSQKRILIQFSLFTVTLITTTLAGIEWRYGISILYSDMQLDWNTIVGGLTFSIPFLGILTVHEFGHYFTAQWHKVKVSFPYYIPLWFGFIGAPSIGTMGAFIRIREMISSRTKYFDIGIAGPLAGFVVALGVLIYGFSNLPPQQYLYDIHPEYEQYGEQYADYVYNDSTVIAFKTGNNLLFEFFKQQVANDPKRVPNDYEMVHYPWLFAGYLALFFTALNLIPIGQLDGGHILYGLLGHKKAGTVSIVLFAAFIFYAGLGLLPFHNDYSSTELLWRIPLYVGLLYVIFSRTLSSTYNNLLLATSVFTGQYFLTLFFPEIEGYPGWIVFGFLLGRILGVKHPRVYDERPLTTGRKILGWIALVIFVLCFTPQPFQT